MFPDQSGWLTALLGPDRPIKALLRKLEYTGPLELLSMFTCMLLCRDCLSRGPELFRDNEKAVIAYRKAYFFTSGGLHAHPGHVARHVE